MLAAEFAKLEADIAYFFDVETFKGFVAGYFEHFAFEVTAVCSLANANLSSNWSKPLTERFGALWRAAVGGLVPSETFVHQAVSCLHVV